MTPEQARALLGLPEPTEKVYDRQAHILKPPMPEVTNRPRSGKVGTISDFLADLDKRARSAQNAAVDYLMPQGGPNVPFPVGLSLYPRMDSSGNVSPAKGLETVDLPLADIAKTIQASDLMGIGGAGRALNEISYGDLPKDAFDAADMALLAPGLAGLIGAAGRTAKGAGRAAKNLAQSDAGYRLANRVAEATGASPLNVIKPGGGNWVHTGTDPIFNHLDSNIAQLIEHDLEKKRKDYSELIDRFGPDNQYLGPVNQQIRQLEADLAERRFTDKNLGKYIRNQMGTESDPIRKAIDQGFYHYNITEATSLQHRGAMSQRLGQGFPAQGLATTPAGKNWETLSDLSINPRPAGYLLDEDEMGYWLKNNPWMAKLPPEEQVYALDRFTRPSHLGFDKLLETLNAEVLAGRIDPEKVNTVKMEDLVRITHERELERRAELERQMASNRKDLPVHKEYPEGYKWVELNKPGSFATESDAMKHSVRGYEPEKGHPDWVPLSGNSGQSNYGHGGWEAIKSGRAKVYSLIDENGKPYVTVETVRPIASPKVDAAQQKKLDELAKQLGRHPTYEEAKKAKEEALNEMPYNVTQVKRFENDVGPEEYPQRQFVTDFMRHKNFDLYDIGSDIDNTGLVSYLSRLTPAQRETLIAGGNDVPEYLTRQELDELKSKLPPASPPQRSYTELEMQDENAFHGRDPYNDLPNDEADEAAYHANRQHRVIGGGHRHPNDPNNDWRIDDPNYDEEDPFKKGGEVHAAGGGMIKALAMINKALQEARAAGKTVEQVSTNRIDMAHKDVTKRVPELTAAAKLLEEGKISKEQYAEMVRMFKPVSPFAEVPRMATKEEMLKALAENQRDKLYLPRNLEEGTPVGGRLNIPSYIRHDTWIPTLHEQVPGFRAGPVIGYDSHFRVGDASFGVEPKSALNYATGKTSKGTFATIKGNYKRTGEEEAMELAREMMSDPRYRQIGMDPERSSMFYDRETFEPVAEAEDVLQVGPIVFARNPRRPSNKQLEDAPYAAGGLSGYKD